MSINSNLKNKKAEATTNVDFETSIIKNITSQLEKIGLNNIQKRNQKIANVQFNIIEASIPGQKSAIGTVVLHIDKQGKIMAVYLMGTIDVTKENQAILRDFLFEFGEMAESDTVKTENKKIQEDKTKEKEISDLDDRMYQLKKYLKGTLKGSSNYHEYSKEYKDCLAKIKKLDPNRNFRSAEAFLNELDESFKIQEGTRQKRIARQNEFDNGHVFHSWYEMTDEEAEEKAKQASIDDPDNIYYVAYDDIMNPSSNIRWFKGKSYTEGGFHKNDHGQYVHHSDQEWDDVYNNRKTWKEIDSSKIEEAPNKNNKYKIVYYLNTACAERRMETSEDIENDWIEEEKEFSSALEVCEYVFKQILDHDDDYLNELYEDAEAESDSEKLNCLIDDFNLQDWGDGETIIVSIEGPGVSFDSGFEKPEAEDDYDSDYDSDYEDEDYDEDDTSLFEEHLNNLYQFTENKLIEDNKDDLQKYKDSKKFLPNQLLQIQWGLEKGLDVSKYADPKFSKEQMAQIRRGLEDQIDVSDLLDSSLSPAEMQEIRFQKIK